MRDFAPVVRGLAVRVEDFAREPDDLRARERVLAERVVRDRVAALLRERALALVRAALVPERVLLALRRELAAPARFAVFAAAAFAGRRWLGRFFLVADASPGLLKCCAALLRVPGCCSDQPSS